MAIPLLLSVGSKLGPGGFASLESAINMVGKLTSSVINAVKESDQFGRAMKRVDMDLVNYAGSAAKGQVDTLKLMQTLAQLNKAGINPTKESLAAMTKAATDMSLTAGTDATQAFEQLSKAVIAGTTEALLPYGIVLSSNQDKTVTQAKALEALTGKYKDANIEVNDLTGGMKRLSNSWGTAFDAFLASTGISEALGKSLNTVADVLDTIAAGLTATTDPLEEAERNLARYRETVVKATKDMNAFQKEMLGMYNTRGGFGTVGFRAVDTDYSLRQRVVNEFETKRLNDTLSSFGDNFGQPIIQSMYDSAQAMEHVYRDNNNKINQNTIAIDRNSDYVKKLSMNYQSIFAEEDKIATDADIIKINDDIRRLMQRYGGYGRSWTEDDMYPQLLAETMVGDNGLFNYMFDETDEWDTGVPDTLQNIVSKSGRELVETYGKFKTDLFMDLQKALKVVRGFVSKREEQAEKEYLAQKEAEKMGELLSDMDYVTSITDSMYEESLRSMVMPYDYEVEEQDRLEKQKGYDKVGYNKERIESLKELSFLYASENGALQERIELENEIREQIGLVSTEEERRLMLTKEIIDTYAQMGEIISVTEAQELLSIEERVKGYYRLGDSLTDVAGVMSQVGSVAVQAADLFGSSEKASAIAAATTTMVISIVNAAVQAAEAAAAFAKRDYGKGALHVVAAAAYTASAAISGAQIGRLGGSTTASGSAYSGPPRTAASTSSGRYNGGYDGGNSQSVEVKITLDDTMKYMGFWAEQNDKAARIGQPSFVVNRG